MKNQIKKQQIKEAKKRVIANLEKLPKNIRVSIG